MIAARSAAVRSWARRDAFGFLSVSLMGVTHGSVTEGELKRVKIK